MGVVAVAGAAVVAVVVADSNRVLAGFDWCYTCRMAVCSRISSKNMYKLVSNTYDRLKIRIETKKCNRI